jgi:hypothetical protein
MKSFLMFLLGAVVGGIASVLITSGVFTGIGAGAGIVTGLKAGACLTVEAAKEEGLITAEQVDTVLNAAVKQIASAELSDEAALSGSDAECVKVVTQLKEAAKKAE